MIKANGKKSQLALLAIAMMVGGFDPLIEPVSKIPYAPKLPIIPKGCKKYCFDKYGWYGIEKMKCSHIVFECIASNKKSAIRKFKNYENSLTINL